MPWRGPSIRKAVRGCTCSSAPDHNGGVTEFGQRLWEPSEQQVRDSAMDRFRREYRPETRDSQDLHDWSVTHPGEFWNAVWDACGVVGDRGADPIVVTEPATEDGTSDLRQTQFFPDARFSYAENLLAGGSRDGANDVAVVYRREDGLRSELTWRELGQEVERVAGWLTKVGVEKGDHVAAWMPNTPATLITMLATNWIGGVFTSTSPDFGVAGVLDRFAQVSPKALVMVDGYRYGGKSHERLPLLQEVAAGLPSLAAIAVVGELKSSPELPLEAAVPLVDFAVANGAAGFADGAGGAADLTNVPMSSSAPVRTSPSDPGFVLYSSGTTGKPKCIVHSAGGLLLKQLTEHQLHCDIRPGDVVFYYTTCGWMMWNWLVTALASGATIVLYEGSPFHPGPEAMWDLAQDEHVTLFGTSAKFLESSSKAGVAPRQSHDLAMLRTITSTGSPLSAEGYEYVYDTVKPDVHLASISGGTDICGCFVIGDPTRPVYAGEIQGPALGTAVDVWDETGESLADRPGERGELVCTQAIPSMPLRFANDPDGSRYQAAYFDRFPGVWAHGDFASWTEHGGVVIHGRSDATLNAGGVRIGTAEIYRQVEQLEEVLEALAIGQEWDGDTRIVLFVKMHPAFEMSDEIAGTLRRTIRVNCSPRHVPARIVAAPDLPRTRSGKLAELAVADVVHGRPVRNTGALANPESLAHFEDLPELQS